MPARSRHANPGDATYRATSRVGSALGAGLLALVFGVAFVATAMAQDKRPPSEQDILAVIDKFDKPQEADAAVEALVKLGEPAVKHLLGEAIEGRKLAKRGWAIVCLAKIGGPQIDERLEELHQDKQQPTLVRTWAAAARVQQASSVEELSKVAPLVRGFPALQRPVGMRMVAALEKRDGPASLEDLIAIEMQVPQLQTTMAPVILAKGPKALAAVMVEAKNQQVANRAAGYLGALSNQGDQSVAGAVAEAYKFDPKAKEVPWRGGALWLPRLNWNLHKKESRQLVGNLVSWFLWCELHDKKQQQRQITNNLRSVNLATASGFGLSVFPNVSAEQLLNEWGDVVGRSGVKALLVEQGVETDKRFKAILDRLK